MAEAQRGDDVVSVELPAPASWKKLVIFSPVFSFFFTLLTLLRKPHCFDFPLLFCDFLACFSLVVLFLLPFELFQRCQGLLFCFILFCLFNFVPVQFCRFSSFLFEFIASKFFFSPVFHGRFLEFGYVCFGGFLLDAIIVIYGGFLFSMWSIFVFQETVFAFNEVVVGPEAALQYRR